MRKMILLAFAALAAVACTRGLDEPAVRGGDEIRFVVGDFPAFGGAQARAVGTEDPGKTEWVAGDELLVELGNNSYGSQYATVTYKENGWELTKGKLVYKEGDPAYVPHVYYAPDYTWGSDGKLELKEGKVAGMDECIEGKANITPNGQGINVSFADATRNYSRLRIATMPNMQITVDINRYIPAGSTRDNIDNYFNYYALTSDEKGNAYLYGTFLETSSHVSVKYKEAPLATYQFSKETENAKSYALDASIISLAGEGITYEQIGDAVKKELDAGRTYINLMLAPDADENTLDEIHYGLQDAKDGSINLTLIGCKKIPSRGFVHFGMLKSIALPDVTEIEGSAFEDCSSLQKVVFGTPLTKVYGNPETFGGVFLKIAKLNI